MCGASSDQKNIAQEQNQNFQTLSSNAQQIFGTSSNIANDLISSFAPVAAAGEGQAGMTPAEYAANKSAIITNNGIASRNAAQSAGERIAAAGGGNAVLPSGQAAATEANIAEAGAQNTANQLTGLNITNAELGRQNWLASAGILAGVPNVFNPATSAGSASTTAGGAAMTGATDVNNANNQWQSDVVGILGDAATLGSKFIPQKTS